MSPGFPERLDPPAPHLLPQVTGRQDFFRQERIMDHRVQPRFALRHGPTLQCLGRRFVPKHLARPRAKDFQIPGITVIDALEVPGTRDDFSVGFPRARPRLQQDK